MCENDNIEIAYDDRAQDYYVIWQPPVAIGSGKTRSEALRDLKKAARLGVDTCISLKLIKVRQDKEG